MTETDCHLMPQAVLQYRYRGSIGTGMSSGLSEG